MWLAQQLDGMSLPFGGGGVPAFEPIARFVPAKYQRHAGDKRFIDRQVESIGQSLSLGLAIATPIGASKGDNCDACQDADHSEYDQDFYQRDA